MRRYDVAGVVEILVPGVSYSVESSTNAESIDDREAGLSAEKPFATGSLRFVLFVEGAIFAVMTTSFKSLRDADMLRGGSLDESSSMSVLFGIEVRDALVRSLGVDKKAEL